MKYIKLFEKVSEKELDNASENDIIYFFAGFYDIVGKIIRYDTIDYNPVTLYDYKKVNYKIEGYIINSDYNDNDNCDGDEYSSRIGNNLYKSVRKATSKEIEKYNLYNSMKKYNL